MSDTQQKAQDATQEAIISKQHTAEVVEKARMAQIEAANEKAEELIVKAEAVAEKLARHTQNSDAKITKSLSDALRDVFGEAENSGRFIDTSRIPLICQDIKGMHSSIESIEENISWIVKLIVGTVVLALLGLVIVSKH